MPQMFNQKQKEKMSNRKYRLLKNMPGTKSGTLFIENYGDDTYEYNSDNGEDCRIRRSSVENSPEWFEELKEPEAAARIKVTHLRRQGVNIGTDELYCFVACPAIPPDKLSEVSRAIEAVVNGDSRVISVIVAGYHGRPQPSDYEKEVRKYAQNYGTVNILCEECGEIGKHKESCSQFEPKFQWTDELVKEFIAGYFVLPSVANVSRFLDVKIDSFKFNNQSGGQSKGVPLPKDYVNYDKGATTDSDPSLGVNELALQIHKNNIEKGFYEKEKNIGEMLCLIHSEVSEALEADRNGKYSTASIATIKGLLKDGEMGFVHYYKDCVKGTFEEEMADIFIRVLDLCAFKGIDLETHVRAKVQYNKSREKYHGKKY